VHAADPESGSITYVFPSEPANFRVIDFFSKRIGILLHFVLLNDLIFSAPLI